MVNVGSSGRQLSLSSQAQQGVRAITKDRTRLAIAAVAGMLIYWLLFFGDKFNPTGVEIFLDQQPPPAAAAATTPAPTPTAPATPTAPRAIASSPVNVESKQYYSVNTIVKFAEPLVKAPQTVVTAYFQIKSKHSSDSYNAWIQNMLSLQDPMVIFLSPALIPQIKELRKHALDRTVIIPMEIDDVPLAVDYNTSFWEHQLDIDKEKKIHKGYQVFWIWLSKSWWVTEAIRHNFFDSDVFVWSDMGCFRTKQYNGKEMVLHVETIPREAMIFLAHHPTNPPPERIWNNKYTRETKQFFYHSGSMMAGYKDTFQMFHKHFMETMQEFLKRDMFIGEDQTVMQSTCLMHPPLCAYVSQDQVRDNFYFGLRYVLHHGGNYKLWYSPPLDAPL